MKKFDIHTKDEIKVSDESDVEELKQFKLGGHFPITEQKLLESLPKVIGHKEVQEHDLEGYRIWKSEFDEGRAGVFTLGLEEI